MVAFTEKQQLKPGMYNGVLIKFTDLGAQEENFPGEEPALKPKISLTFEFTDELMKDGRPFVQSRDYTASFAPSSKLSEDINSWQGTTIPKDYVPFFKGLLGKGAAINITQTKTGNSKIGSINPLMKGQTTPKPYNKLVFFDMLNGLDLDAFNSLTSFEQNKIKASPEYKALSTDAPF